MRITAPPPQSSSRVNAGGKKTSQGWVVLADPFTLKSQYAII